MAKPTYPANKGGIPYGAKIITEAGFPALVAGRSNKNLTFALVFGFEVEMGDCYTAGCVAVSDNRWAYAMEQFGHDHKNPVIHDKKLAGFLAE